MATSNVGVSMTERAPPTFLLRNVGIIMIKSRFGILVVFWGVFASPLFATEEYVVGVGDYDYLPHHGLVDREYTGYAREVLDLFSQTSGYLLTYRPLPWKRVIHEYIRGDVDFVFPDNPHWDTEAKEGKDVQYSNTVVTYIDGVVVLPENKGKGISHLKILGTVRGFTSLDYYDDIESGQIELSENTNFIPLLQQVLMKRVDGAYIEVSVANYYLREHLKKPGALVFDADLPHTEDSYYLSSIKYPQIIQEFNEFLTAEQDAIETLQKKYKVGAFAQ